ncbi:MAG: hypothetical protein JXA52_05865 [Planctomycetes bacterium]|nr:hypothetical protein [Planctomycetota bacterium]
MADDQEQEQESKGFSRWWWMLPLFLLFIVVLAALGFRASFSQQNQAIIDSLHAQGYPITPEEVNAWYSTPPPGENAAELYLQAFSVYVDWDTEEYREKKAQISYFMNWEYLDRSIPYPDEHKGWLDEFLEDNKEMLDLLYAAAKMPACRYPIDLTEGASTLVSHLKPVRDGSGLLALDALRYTLEKDGEKAARAVHAGVALGRSLRREPLLVSQLVRFASDEYTFKSIEEVLNRIPLDEAQLKSLGSMFEQEADPKAMLHGLFGEQSSIYDVFESVHNSPLGAVDIIKGHSNIRGIKKSDIIISACALLYSFSGTSQADMKFYLEMMIDYFAIAELPAEERLAAAKTLKAKLSNIPSHLVISRMMLPSITGVFTRELQHIANMRLVQAALAVERYRLRHGKLPDSLSDLKPEFLPEIPLDPFDGKLLRYKLLAKGYMVYSIGQDQADNGGLDYKKIGSLRPWDVGADLTLSIERTAQEK